MTDSDAGDRPVLIWITEGTWRASVDAALGLVPAGAPITLLHVIPAELPEAAHGAYLGLFGRGQPGRDPAGASPNSPPSQPASCSTPPPGAWAGHASGWSVAVSPNGKW